MPAEKLLAFVLALRTRKKYPLLDPFVPGSTTRNPASRGLTVPSSFSPPFAFRRVAGETSLSSELTREAVIAGVVTIAKVSAVSAVLLSLRASKYHLHPVIRLPYQVNIGVINIEPDFRSANCTEAKGIDVFRLAQYALDDKTKP